MGKSQNQTRVDSDGNGTTSSSSRCSMCILRRVRREFSCPCVFFLMLGFVVFVSGIFWIVPLLVNKSGFDADDTVKLNSAVKASFELEKPVSELVNLIRRLEYDIYGEIGAPGLKVSILSMHKSTLPNYTRVEFGVLSDPINSSISEVTLSLLRSSLVGLFLQHFNLTLTTSIFGNTSDFQILKFPGGVTVIPTPSAPVWQIPEILFNFILNSSISEIQEYSTAFKEQLYRWLHLRSYENLYVQITSPDGSTVASPIIVEASVISNFGSLSLERLKQLAETITGSPAENLGLDDLVFGKVNGVSLSAYLKNTLQPGGPFPSPASAPAPSPEPSGSGESSVPPFPAGSTAPSPNYNSIPPSLEDKGAPNHAVPPLTSLPPSAPASHPPDSCHFLTFGAAPRASPSHSSPPSHPSVRYLDAAPSSPIIASKSDVPSNFAPQPGETYGSNSNEQNVEDLVTILPVPSSSCDAGSVMSLQQDSTLAMLLSFFLHCTRDMSVTERSIFHASIHDI